MNMQLDIQNEVEQIINIQGFVPALCQCLAGIASSDGAITLDEYTLIVATTIKFARISDNPALVNIFTLQGIISETKLDSSLKILSKKSHTISDKNKKIILETSLPLISAQLRSHEIKTRFSRALGIKENTVKGAPDSDRLRHFLPDHPLKSFTLVKKHLSAFVHTNILSTSFQQLSKIESFAYRFNEPRLMERLKELQSHFSQDNLDALNQQLHESKHKVLENLQSFKQQMELLCQQNSAADQLTTLAKTLYEQVEQRLIEIQNRAELQKQLFKEDIDEFIEQSVNEVELNLRQQLELDDWTKAEVWENFAKTDAAKALSKHYEKVQRRYERIFSQWNKEFSSFSQELSLTQQVILQGLEKQELSQLILPPSPRLKVLQQLDGASSLILNTLKMAGAGTMTIGGVAIATGIPASLFLVSATTIGGFFISNPVGWAAIGTITLAGLYQYLSNPTARKSKEIKNTRHLIEEGLKKMIGYPVETHNQHMDYIVENFHKTAKNNFQPLLQDTNLAVRMNKMQLEVIKKINQSAMQELAKL